MMPQTPAPHTLHNPIPTGALLPRSAVPEPGLPARWPAPAETRCLRAPTPASLTRPPPALPALSSSCFRTLPTTTCSFPLANGLLRHRHPRLLMPHCGIKNCAVKKLVQQLQHLQFAKNLRQPLNYRLELQVIPQVFLHQADRPCHL